MRHAIGLVLLAALVPLSAAAQPEPQDRRAAHWQPALYAGTWGGGSSARSPGEPGFGPMAAVEVRRSEGNRRVTPVATLSGYTKARGQMTVSSPSQSRDYRLRQDLLMLSIGGDVGLVRGPTDWTIGLSVGAATSRITFKEISATGLPLNNNGEDPGWGGVTAVLAARSSVSLPLAARWGLRVGMEVLQGVEAFDGRPPIVGAHVGIVMRR